MSGQRSCHVANEFSIEEEDPFQCMTGAGSVCTKGTQSYTGEQISICVDFYSYMVQMRIGKLMIDQIISLLAQNSQNYQNYKSFKLEIMVRSIILVLLYFALLLLYFIC